MSNYGDYPHLERDHDGDQDQGREPRDPPERDDAAKGGGKESDRTERPIWNIPAKKSDDLERPLRNIPHIPPFRETDDLSDFIQRDE